MITLGTKLRKISELKNLKQEYVAEKIGISQSSYSKMEKDEVEISHERLEQIAKAFDLPLIDILSFDLDRLNSTSEKKVFNVMYNQNGTGEIHIQHYHEFSEQV